MYEIEITSLQKSYLLKLADEHNNITITQFSEIFQCSKVNSKAILDRMVKIGLLYKEKKVYLFTVLGKNIANDLILRRNYLQFALETMIHIDKSVSKNQANILVCQDIDSFTDELIKYAKRCDNMYDVDTKINVKQLEKLIGTGEFNISFCIYRALGKQKGGSELSMANLAFERKGKLVIGEESYIQLNTKGVKKISNGYIKKAILLNISHMDKSGQTIMCRSENSSIKIPLDICNEWCFVEKNMLQCGIYLNTYTKIGFLEHSKKGLFVFNINLFNI